jgi:hypothetical protein
MSAMDIALKLGSKVKLRRDNGWAQPGCLMSFAEKGLHIYWPDEDVFTYEREADVVPYTIGVALHPQEVEIAA